MMENRVVYVYDINLQKQCDRIPTLLKRASIVQDLINTYKLLLNENVVTIASKPASEDELKYFHSTAYIEFLKTANKVEDLEIFEEEQVEFGLGYDCPLLTGLYDLTQTLAAGSLTAAKELAAGRCDIAINWCGGWHHAQREGAEGFCYVNDVVIAIQKLTEKFSKILYIDLDIHHGNGVQNAFEFSKKVLTVSFHKHSPGFYPGTGTLNEFGRKNGKYHSLNIPLLEGFSNRTYLKCFIPIFSKIRKTFKPSVIVVQCGADSLNGDPIGEANMTLKGMGQCIQEILNCKIPTLFLGGGGYNFPNAARYWAYISALIIGMELNNDIPDSCKYFTMYKPTYELQIDEGNQKDCNSEDYTESVIKTILDYCNHLDDN